MKRLLSCTSSEMLKMDGQELKQAILASEGRTVMTETVVAIEPLLGDLTNAELAVSFGSDMVLLNCFDCNNPEIKGLPECDNPVEKLKEIVGRPIGCNLEPVDLEAELMEERRVISTGRQARKETYIKAQELGFNFICLTGNPGNDFARSIYKNLDAIKIFKESLNKQAKAIDVIQCKEDLYCINVFCCGLDADVGNLVNTNRKTTLFPRIMQYSLTILNKIFHLKFYPTDIYTYNKDIYQGNVLICTFCNGHYFGGGYQAGYYSSLEDGMIDMSVVPEISKKELPYYLKGLITNTLHKTKKFQHFKEDDVWVKTNQYVNIDGEKYEPGTYHLKCLHKKIQLVY